ncbi:unnamed protein product [Linum trigynum]|uniref:Uncharacterized protein n=1 Tax=Linum trigynum TaxID=586398 RepID=A0AAV2GMB5_9ROSI
MGAFYSMQGGEERRKGLTWIRMNRADKVDGDAFAEKLMNSIEARSFDVVQVQNVLLHQNNRPHDLIATAGAAILEDGNISGLHTASFHDFLQHFFLLDRSCRLGREEGEEME